MHIKQHSQLGFLLPVAIFLMVILAGLGAYAVNITSVQHQTNQQDLQATRVYYRAKGIIEYAMYQILTADTSTSLPSCPTINTTVNGIDNLNTSTLTLTCTESDYTEQGGDTQIRIYNLQSQVSSGSPGNPDYYERQIDIALEHRR